MTSESAEIETPAQALEFYAVNLAGARKITCRGEAITVVFERDATHVYTEGVDDTSKIDPALIIRRDVPAGRGRMRPDIRVFSPGRARLMNQILPAISLYAVSVPEAGGRPGHQKTVLYGPPLLGGGSRLRVVLRPGPGDAFTCVSAYPVSESAFLNACRLKRAKFPP
jgi:hypothetical protein